MYQPMLALHWKQIRFGLIPFILAAFALPLLTVQGIGGIDPSTMALSNYRTAVGYNAWLPMIPALAAALGTTLALSAWSWDHNLKHVYALSLPIARWRYAIMKMGAGAALALLPVAAFGAGCLIASASVNLPVGLHAYPVALTVRFLFGTMLAYGMLFALAAGTIRTTVVIFSGVALLLLFAIPLTHLATATFPSMQQTNVAEWFFSNLVDLPGPLSIFTGNWALIDV